MNTSLEGTRRAVVYTRVSTGEQADKGTSLIGQLEACRNKAAAIGAEVVGVYEDAGVSGALYHSRLGIQAALRDLELRKADTLIIANLSRFSRDREHQSTIKKRVETAGGRLVFCDIDFANTPEGDLAFGIMGTFADYERKVIRERTTKGRRKRAEQGLQPCRTFSPFGYHIVSNKDVLSGSYPPDTVGTYQIVEDQARWVREIFARFANGQPLRSVARWLTESGVVTTRGGLAWNQTTLFRLLKHPVYKGQAPYGRSERCYDESRAQKGYKMPYVLKERPAEQWVYIEAPALVDEATWNACQERFAQNRTTFSGRADRRYLLTGLMRCPQCGRKMRCNRMRVKSKTATYHNFYECRFARPSSNTVGVACHNKQYRGDWVEPLVTDAIREATQRPELIRAALKAYRQTQAQSCPQADIAQLRQQLEELHRQEQATAKAQIAGIMAGADTRVYESLLSDIATKRGHIQKALARLEPPLVNQSSSRKDDDATLVARALADVDQVLNATDNELSPAEKQGLLSTVIEAIHPQGDAGLRIDLKPALTPCFDASALTVQYFTT